MADNVIANANTTTGATFATAAGSWSGDTANFPGCFLAIVSGSEGSWTISQVVGGAGAVTAGTQRVTLASDDPAVASLSILDDWDSSDACKVVGPAAHDAAASGNPLMIGAEFDDTAPDSVDEGDVGRLRISANRNLYVTLRDAAGNERGLNIDSSGNIGVTDASGSLTVDNGGTFAVQAAQSGTWNITNVSGTVSLPTGAATAAKQPALGTAGTASSDVITVQGIASMTALKVDGSAVTQPVSGTVAVTNASLTTLAGAVYAEDVASANADPGIQVLAVQKATPADTAGTDGDYQPLQMAGGRLWVDASGKTLTVASHAVTNAGTFACQIDGSALTALQLIDNIVLAEDAGHSSGDPGVMALAVRSNTAASTSGSDGDYQPLITNTTGHLWVDASGQTLTVGSHAVTNAGTFAVQATVAAGATNIAKAEDVASADADVGVPAMAVRKATPANTSGTDGDYEMLQMSAGRLWASATIDAALPAGTNAIGKLSSNAGVTIGAVEIASAQTLATVTTVTTCSTVTTVSTLTGGGVAHDGADSGNPIKVGARAALTLSDDNAVANGDRTDNVSDGDGALIVRQGFPLGDLISERVTDTGGTSTAFSNFGAVASTRSYITAICVFNSSATAGYVDFRDGTAGSVLFTVPLPAGGGAVVTLAGAPLFRTTANTALAYDVSAALSTVYISVTGYKSKV